MVVILFCVLSMFRTRTRSIRVFKTADIVIIHSPGLGYTLKDYRFWRVMEVRHLIAKKQQAGLGLTNLALQQSGLVPMHKFIQVDAAAVARIKSPSTPSDLDQRTDRTSVQKILSRMTRIVSAGQTDSRLETIQKAWNEWSQEPAEFN